MDTHIEEIIQKTVERTLTAAIPLFEQMAKQAAEAAAASAAKVGAAAGAKAAIDTIEKERKRVQRARYDKRLHNTKLLLRNYRTFSEHCANAVYKASAPEADLSVEDIFDLMEEFAHDDDLYVESIKKSAERTAIIMEHVNKMLDVYKAYCYTATRKDYQRHYRVIEALYLSPAPATSAQVAKDENIDKRTVYKDVDAACEVLTALIFGIDGVRRQ